MELPDIVKELPPAPAAVPKWILREVVQETYIIYDKKTDKAACTRCGAEYSALKLENLKHNGTGICPKCKSKAAYKAAGIGRKSLTEQTRVLVFVRKRKSVYATLTEVDIDFRGWRPEIRTWMSAVYKFDRNQQLYVKRHPEWYWTPEHWESVKKVNVPSVPCGGYNFEPRRNGLHVYTDNWERVFPKSDLNYADVPKVFREHSLTGKNLIRYMDIHLKYPSIELLRKAGFWNIVWDQITEQQGRSNVCWRGKDLRKILRLDMGRVRKIKKMELDTRELGIYQSYLKQGAELNYEEITLIEGSRTKEQIENVTDYIKAVRYIATQRKKHGQHVTMNDYAKYLEDLQKLGLDIRKNSLLFPEHFMESHVQRANEVTAKANEIEERQVREAGERFLNENGEYHFNGFFIRPAKSADEIRQEGSRQGHCVAGYVRHVAEGRCLILFIRKESDPDEAYYTLELSSQGNVLQCRGMYCPKIKRRYELQRRL